MLESLKNPKHVLDTLDYTKTLLKSNQSMKCTHLHIFVLDLFDMVDALLPILLGDLVEHVNCDGLNVSQAVRYIFLGHPPFRHGPDQFNNIELQ